MASCLEIVTGVISRYGFDATQDEVLGLLNERHSTMCVDAELLIPRRDIGPTVADQADYDLSELVADVKAVLVDGVPIDYAPEVFGDVYDLDGTGGTIYWSFHPKANGGSHLHITPAPSESGLALEARVVERPADLTINQTPLVPKEFHRALREGVAASLMAEDAEQSAVADRLEARFDMAVEKLRRQLRRGRRSGPARITLWWP